MSDVRQVPILRYAAFSERPDGGNPAGVVLDASGMDDEAMQSVAADVGYSETAFLLPGEDGYAVRYFTPEIEVSFCGHATIAAAAALGERDGPGRVILRAPAGRLALETRADDEGRILAGMRTVAPSSHAVDEADVADALRALGWTAADLDPALPPRVACAGARHLILAARRRERLATLDYDYDALGEVARRLALITVALVWRQDASTFRARNAGPSVGIVEDPATGAAAAALGGYLAELGHLTAPARLTILQGAEMGRPSRLTVELDPGHAGVLVSGAAVRIVD